jgi:predicted helicase
MPFDTMSSPATALGYRLGSRSALEWVIDQYQVKSESDPNREDDPGYVVRLVGQVVRVAGQFDSHDQVSSVVIFAEKTR